MGRDEQFYNLKNKVSPCYQKIYHLAFTFELILINNQKGSVQFIYVQDEQSWPLWRVVF